MEAGTSVGLYDLPLEFAEFRDTIRRIVADRVAPRAAEIDASAEYPWDLRALFAEHDLLGLPFSAAFGGTGSGTLMLNIAVEEVARACATSALIVMVQDLGTLPIRLFGTPEQQHAWLPRCASGEWTPAFALSESEAGSDPASMRTRAVRDGDEWIISGAKNWTSNASIAEFYVVFALTDNATRRITAFVVEADRPGFAVGKLEHKLGIRGMPTASLTFDDVRVPDANRIGDVGKGLSVALATLERSRLGAAAQAVGIAQGAIDYAIGYAKQRVAFGSPIIALPVMQAKLADMQTKTAAARQLLYRASAMADRNDPELGMYSSMAKLFASDTAMEVTIEAVQVLGGYGYVSEYPVERMMRDAKITQIYEGTNEIQRLVIGRALAR